MEIVLLQDELEIPDNWQWSTLGEIRRDESRSINPSAYPEQQFELYSVPSYSDGKPEIIRGAEIGSSKITVERNYVLLCKINPRINRVWVVAGHTELPKIASTEWIPFSPVKGVDPKYLKYYMTQDSFRDFLASNASGVGGSLMRVRPSTIRDYPFPLSPLPEQQRIVNEIEKQFSRLDAAEAALKHLQANLERYRASVLNAAFTGQLLPQEQYDEPAEALLECILAERRRQWEEQEWQRLVERAKKKVAQAKRKAAGLPSNIRDLEPEDWEDIPEEEYREYLPKNDKWKQKYKEPEGPDTEGLPELPEGWCWATVELLAAPGENSITDGPFGSKLKTAHYTESGPRVIRLQNIGDGEFIDEKAHISEEHFETLSKHQVYAGDVVIGALGTSLPRSCIVPEYVGKAIVKADCIRFHPNPEFALPEYINIVLNSEQLKRYATHIVHGVGRPRLNQQEIKALPIPVPPLDEQKRIVEAVEQRLSIVKAIASDVETNLRRTQHLRQSILKQAFTGKLVPQDPNDEPASELLKRMNSSKGQVQASKSEVRTGEQLALFQPTDTE